MDINYILIKSQSEHTTKTSQTGYRDRNLGLDPDSLISVIDINMFYYFVNYYYVMNYTLKLVRTAKEHVGMTIDYIYMSNR